MTFGKTVRRRSGALLLAGALLAAAGAPAFASSPPAAAPPTSAAASDADTGLAAFLADWLQQLFDGDDPKLPGGGQEETFDTRNGPIGPLIDPNGHTPKDPGPMDDHGSKR